MNFGTIFLTIDVMAQLGNRFPESEIEQHIERQLTAGSVLYIQCDFTTPPKEKFVVFLSRGNQRPLLFFINSRIRPFVARQPYLARCQVTLAASAHSFLRHDSFADCSNVIRDMSEQEIKSQLRTDVGRIRGRISDAVLKQILPVIESATTISGLHKQMIKTAFERIGIV